MDSMEISPNELRHFAGTVKAASTDVASAKVGRPLEAVESAMPASTSIGAAQSAGQTVDQDIKSLTEELDAFVDDTRAMIAEYTANEQRIESSFSTISKSPALTSRLVERLG